MSTYKDQKADKPKIEDVAGKYLAGDNLTNLLDFLSFLKDNRLNPRWDYTNRWSFNYKSKKVCYISISDSENAWTFFPQGISLKSTDKWFEEYNRHITDGGVKELVWSNLYNKECKGGKCKGLVNHEIMGRVFDRVCFCWSIRIKNPDSAALDNSKKLVIAIKTIIADSVTACKA